MHAIEDNSLNVRLISCGEKALLGKTVQQLRQTYSSRYAPAGPAGRVPQRTPRSTVQTPRARGASPGASSGGFAADRFRGVPYPARDSSSDSASTDSSLGGLTEEMACHMADMMQAQARRLRAGTAAAQRDIDELVHRVQEQLSAARRGPGPERASPRRGMATSTPSTLRPGAGSRDAHARHRSAPTRPRAAARPAERPAARPESRGEPSCSRAQQGGFTFGTGQEKRRTSLPPTAPIPRAGKVEVAFVTALDKARALKGDARHRALKKLAVKWHPDRHPEDPQLATRLFQMIDF